MPPVHFIQTNSMFKGFSVEHRHVLREDANSEPNLPPPVLFFFLLSLCQLWFCGKGVNIRIGLSTFYLIWDRLAHLSSVFSSRRTNEISVRCFAFSHREMSEDAHQYLIHPLSLHGARL